MPGTTTAVPCAIPTGASKSTTSSSEARAGGGPTGQPHHPVHVLPRGHSRDQVPGHAGLDGPGGTKPGGGGVRSGPLRGVLVAMGAELHGNAHRTGGGAVSPSSFGNTVLDDTGAAAIGALLAGDRRPRLPPLRPCAATLARGFVGVRPVVALRPRPLFANRPG